MAGKSKLLIIDIDDCPITDNPVIKVECTGCKHYVDFEIWGERPCVKCSWSFTPD